MNKKMLLGIGLVGVGAYLLWKQNSNKVFANAAGSKLAIPPKPKSPYWEGSNYGVFSNCGQSCTNGTCWDGKKYQLCAGANHTPFPNLFNF
jgi:hypothetical protein